MKTLKLRMPWRLRALFAWVGANRHALTGRLRMRPPSGHRIMVSTALFGGVGGTEKHLKAIVESMPDCLFSIRAGAVRTRGFVPRTANFRVNWPEAPGTAFDLYLYFAGGGKPPYEGDRFRFTKKLLETNGADVRDLEDRFDCIAIQTGNHARYCTQHHKCVPAFPDVPATFPGGRRPLALPERFFLTVFNPFSDLLKGQGTLYRAADAAALPIVWCFSDGSGFDFSGLPDHPNLVKLKNLPQEELYYVYEHAAAYVSFSHIESFGWSLAEAFYLGLPIISREVGFLTYVKGQPGIHVYGSEEELRLLLGRSDFRRQVHDDALFRDHAYPAVIDRLLD